MSAADLADDLVLRWGLVYTRDLDAASARDRLHELASDLHEQLAHDRAAGRPEPLIAASVLRRAAVGAPDDLSWRRDVLRMRLPRPARARLALANGALGASILLAAGLSGLGAWTFQRAAAWIDTSGAINVPASLYAVIPLALLAFVALGLLCATRTRDLGGLLLLAPALLLPFMSLHVLSTASATVAATTLLSFDRWELGVALASAALDLPVVLTLTRRLLVPAERKGERA